jgi:hypothetical protein
VARRAARGAARRAPSSLSVVLLLPLFINRYIPVTVTATVTATVTVTVRVIHVIGGKGRSDVHFQRRMGPAFGELDRLLKCTVRAQIDKIAVFVLVL